MIRAGTLGDVPRAAALRQRAWPDTIITAEGMRHHLASDPEEAERALIAVEEGGDLLGWAYAGRAWWRSEAEMGVLELAVDPGHRARGIATQLMDAVEAHLEQLGVVGARAESLDEPAARTLARNRGFEQSGSSSISAVDPRTVEPLPLPAGVSFLPFRDLDDPEPVWALDLEVSRDIPDEDFSAVELEQWVREFWRAPTIDDDASLAAFVDGELVAVTMIRVDRASGRARSNLAGTRREYRGRGIATALKSHSLARAAALGATIALTDNEERNAGMLAVNRKLGYRPFARRLTWERTTAA